MTSTTHTTPTTAKVAGTDDQTEAGTIMFLLLHDGFTVSRDFYESIRHQLEDVLPGLVPDGKYTAKMLCGREFWGKLEANDQRMAGKCVADMVVKKLVRLTFVKWEHEFPKKYRLI